MQFIHDIRAKLIDFETDAAAEIHRFLDWLMPQYAEPTNAVVAPPAPLAQPEPSTYTAPVVQTSPAAEEVTIAQPVTAEEAEAVEEEAAVESVDSAQQGA